MPEESKPMTGPGFWIMVLLLSFDEVLDLFVNLSVVFAIFAFFTGILIGSITIGYLYFSGVHWDISKAATLATSVGIEIMPFLSILPASIIGFFTIRMIEHRKYEKRMEEFRKKASSVPRGAPSPA